jgi:hypothetical protein
MTAWRPDIQRSGMLRVDGGSKAGGPSRSARHRVIGRSTSCSEIDDVTTVRRSS